MYKYKVSVIMAVYNVEPFLREAIDSVIAQDIGFENIQLILVDDGSPDGSGAICDEYAAKYPNNIVVIHKENGGVSSARNTGLDIAEGEYLNFMDADDLLSPNVCSAVTEFFSAHYSDIDVVAFPMYFFDGQTGPHILNNKFRKGSRVIDLRKEYDLIQLSTASSFLKQEALLSLNLHYDTRLCFTEDAKLLVPLLCEKMRLGVVSTCRYEVRRRTISQSATQQSASRREWWLDTIKYFQKETIEFCMSRYGFLPRYVQYLLAYDLQWRFQQPSIPKGLLSDEEINEFRCTLALVLAHIDDNIILQQKNIWREHKNYALQLKYGRNPNIYHTSNNIQFYYQENEILSLEEYGLNFSFLSFQDDALRIDGFLMLCKPDLGHMQFEAHSSDGQVFVASEITGPKSTLILDEPAMVSHAFSFTIPVPKEGRNDLVFYIRHNASLITVQQFRFGKYFPLSKNNKNSYFFYKGIRVTYNKNQISIEKCSNLSHMNSERKLLIELFRKNKVGGRKAVVARILYYFVKLFKRKPLILISDRITRGGDNGEAMFRYIQANHRKEVHAVFVVSQDSSDFSRLRKLGPAIDAQSHLHKLLHLLCDYNLASSAEIHTVNPFAGYESHYCDLLNHVKFVFLQHGITKDDISGWINRYEKNMHGIVAAANAEHEAFLDSRYCYRPENIWLTGFPRFDRLYRDEQQRIAIVPTWRKPLMGKLNPQTGLWSVSPNFADSDFLKFYRGLLNNTRLHDAIRIHGYTLQFFPHPNLLGVLDQFEAPESVEVLDASTQYRDLYAQAELIVTDYSSAVFDFAYLRKPVIYCQFDADTFFSGAHSYEKGYFDYEQDGFGEVEYSLDATVDRIIEYIESGCQLKEIYRCRIDRFFAYNDQNNCRRVYEKIISTEHAK